jgi:hypothetical protein
VLRDRIVGAVGTRLETLAGIVVEAERAAVDGRPVGVRVATDRAYLEE